MNQNKANMSNPRGSAAVIEKSDISMLRRVSDHNALELFRLFRVVFKTPCLTFNACKLISCGLETFQISWLIVCT